MRSFKRIIAVVSVIVLVIVANELLTYLLYPNGTVRVEMHAIEEGGYEQLVVGSSHGKSGIDPEMLTDMTGLSTFNICQGGEYPEDIVYVAKDAAKHNDLKRIIYEVDPAYWQVTPNETENYVMFYQDMSFSTVKLEYFWDKMLDADFRTSLTTWYMYRKNIKRIPEIVKTKQTDVYKEYKMTEAFATAANDYTDRGFWEIYPLPIHKETEDVPILWSGEGIREKSEESLLKLINFCKEENIELVFVIMPVPNVTYEKYYESYQEGADFVKNFAELEGIRLINYWTDEEEANWDLDGYMDYDGHMYGDTARTFTELLGEKL